MYLLVEEAWQTLCGGLGGGVCHLDLQLGLVGQAVAEEGGRAPAHGRALGKWQGEAGAAARARTCVQLPLRPEPRHRDNNRDVKCRCWPPAAAASAQVYYYCECPLMAKAPSPGRHSASSNVAQNTSQDLYYPGHGEQKY